MASSPLLSAKLPWLERFFPNQEWVLGCVILSEIALFGATAHNFLTGANAGEIVRLAVELGLLALALTCVIITGGIDLSVGSLMGLCAVVFGMLFKESGVGVEASRAQILKLFELSDPSWNTHQITSVE